MLSAQYMQLPRVVHAVDPRVEQLAALRAMQFWDALPQPASVLTHVWVRPHQCMLAPVQEAQVLAEAGVHEDGVALVQTESVTVTHTFKL